MRRFTSSSPICNMMKSHQSTAKNVRKNNVFASALMGFHRIANWRAGGEFAHNSPLFLYTILFNKINTQRLNCLDSFWIYDCGQAIRGWPGFARPVADTRPSVDGPGHPRMPWVRDWPRTYPTPSLVVPTSVLPRHSKTASVRSSFRKRSWLCLRLIFPLCTRGLFYSSKGLLPPPLTHATLLCRP